MSDDPPTGDPPSGGPPTGVTAGSGPTGAGGGDGAPPDGAVVVHPRMRRRRIAVRRDAGRRRLKRATAVLGVAVVVLAGYVASQTPLLDVDRVEVGGARRTPVAAVVGALGVERGDPMVDVDRRAARRRIEALPWVRRAEVRRVWPGTVSVEITERRPVAAVPVVDERVALVDAEGRVLAVDAERPDGSIELTGVDEPIGAGGTVGAEARRALDLVAALDERLPGVVTAVSVDLVADLAVGGTVRFGSTDDLDEKVLALEAVLKNVDMACVATIDVRVPRSPALTRAEGCP